MHKFQENIFESSETLVKQPPGHLVDIKGESTMDEDLFGCKTAPGSLVQSFEMMTLQLQEGIWDADLSGIPNSKVHWANVAPIWDRQDPGGPHVAPMNFTIWYGQVQSLIFVLLFLSLHYAIFWTML